ncbi:MAG: glycosyltransferase family 4 protein [Pyrinomonadaceae bacterium]|nr:glycosyltransferase family 4 protein [Pyrinomonadaceae bacterium]
MKVLITAPSLDEHKNVSGISTLVAQIIKHGAAEFSHFQAGKQDGEKIGGRWFLQQLFLVPRFLRQLRREKIDLVHLNTALVPLSIGRDFALATAARIAGRPILLHLHGGRYLMKEFENRALAWLTEKMFRFAGVIVVLSELEKESLLNRWKNLDVRILPNAVAIDEVPDAERELKEEKTIIFLGRLHESKGLLEIVEACRTLKNENLTFRFNCFGAGAMQDFFVAEMSRMLGDKFYFGGVVGGAEKWKQLAASDIFLLPSRYGEGLPIAMLEAMAANCVVVAADVASVRAVIEDGANGFLVEPYNAAQVVEKLKILLSGNADWGQLRRNARATVKEKYALNDYLKKLENLYAEISLHDSKR